MKIKTIRKEDEIHLILTQSELVWVQVLLNGIINGDELAGWVKEVTRLGSILNQLKKEGERVKPTTEEFENSKIDFLNK